MTQKLAPRFLTAAWLGLACYCVLSVLVGKGGLIASSSVSMELGAMRANLSSLRAANTSLSIKIAALQSDPDRIVREARPLGWLAKGDYEIVLVDRNSGLRFPPSAGSVISVAEPSGFSDLDIKLATLLVGIVAFGLSFFRDRIMEEERSSLQRAVPR